MNLYSGFSGVGQWKAPTPTPATTADNGLNINPANNVQFGGDLTKDTNLNGINNFALLMEAIKQYGFYCTNNFSGLNQGLKIDGIVGLTAYGEGATIAPEFGFQGSDTAGRVSFKIVNNPQNLVAFVINQYIQITMNGSTKFIPLGIPT